MPIFYNTNKLKQLSHKCIRMCRDQGQPTTTLSRSLSKLEAVLHFALATSDHFTSSAISTSLPTLQIKTVRNYHLYLQWPPILSTIAAVITFNQEVPPVLQTETLLTTNRTMDYQAAVKQIISKCSEGVWAETRHRVKTKTAIWDWLGHMFSKTTTEHHFQI